MTDWDARHRTGDTPWDRGMAHPLLAMGGFDKWLQGNVLVPGCGTGHDVRLIAEKGASPTGLDLSSTAIERAHALSKGNEEFVTGDLFAPKPEWAGRFEVVFEHTCFCAIDPRRRADYVSAVNALLKSGGVLAAIFFIDTGSDEGPPFSTNMEELERLFGRDFVLVETWTDFPTYEGREGCERAAIYRKSR